MSCPGLCGIRDHLKYIFDDNQVTEVRNTIYFSTEVHVNVKSVIDTRPFPPLIECERRIF